MTWAQLSFREWQRRPLRSALAATGVGVAIATLFSLLAFQSGYRAGVQDELQRLGAHVLVVPKGCPYDAASIALHGANWPCFLKAQYLNEVRAAPGVASAAPALMSASYDEAGVQSVYVGIETNMLALKRTWRIQGAFPQRPGDILIGSAMAARRRWKLGQAVELSGDRKRSARVAGILASTQGADDSFIFLPLADAQEWLRHPGELTHILVRLNDPNDLEAVVRQLRGCDAGLFMNVVPLGHLFQTIQSVVNSTRLLLGCLALVAFLAAGIGVSNALLMAVAERTQEIGILRALGASRGQIYGLFWFETLQVCLAGAALGVATAHLASHALDQWLRGQLPFAPAGALVHWENWIGFACLGSAVALGSLAGFLPAWRAAVLPPMEAMRRAGGVV